MFIRTSTEKYTGGFSAEIDRLADAFASSEAIVIGAGSGLSTSAGYTYSGERFMRYFADFSSEYGFKDMYSGGFYPYKTPEEFWCYWSRYIEINRYLPIPKPVYSDLLKLVKHKDYFVLTTNVDHCFQRVGFDKKRLFYTQGDYGLFQCSVPCHERTFDNEQIIKAMIDRQDGMTIPTELVPKCPICGAPMTMNLRSDDTFVQDDGWYAASKRYTEFIQKHAAAKTLFLELGVGGNTPVIIKYPFWRMTAGNPNSIYACVNLGEAVCPPQIADRSFCINADIGSILVELLKRL